MGISNAAALLALSFRPDISELLENQAAQFAKNRLLASTDPEHPIS